MARAEELVFAFIGGFDLTRARVQHRPALAQKHSEMSMFENVTESEREKERDPRGEEMAGKGGDSGVGE